MLGMLQPLGELLKGKRARGEQGGSLPRLAAISAALDT